MVSASATERVAVFDFELVDTSLDGSMNGANSAETARLLKLAPRLREALAKSGRFDVVELGPVASVAHETNLQACGGCDASLAKSVGAELSITGTVQKVSNLILNMNLYVRDSATKAVVATMSADFRGNTDESWSRALEWLIRNRLLAPGFGAH